AAVQPPERGDRRRRDEDVVLAPGCPRARRSVPSTDERGHRAPAARRRQPADPQGRRRRPVAAYIAAMPGWKARVGRHIDAVVTDRVPGVRKAVRWNQPYYGAPDDDGWFLAFRCYTAYVQLQFFRGTELHPVPPKASR